MRVLRIFVFLAIALIVRAGDPEDEVEYEWEKTMFSREDAPKWVKNFETDCDKYECKLKDTDGDGLSDFEEVTKWGTNPAKIDTDEDGCAYPLLNSEY